MLKSIKEKFFPTKKKDPPAYHKIDGVTSFFRDYDKGYIAGWSRSKIKVGDYFTCRMQSGQVGRFKLVDFKRMMDPADQFFGTVVPLGYLGQTAADYWKKQGLMYVSTIQFDTGHGLHTVTRKLDFIAYHLIKHFHGDDGLLEMAVDTSKYNYSGPLLDQKGKLRNDQN